MNTKERIQAVIDSVGDDRLDALYEVVSEFAVAQNGTQQRGIMEKLRSIKKIHAPVDFATNLDQYTCGEKRVEGHLS